MNQIGWIALVVANIPVYFGLGWLLFGDWDEFLESLWFWIGCCAACVVAEGWLIQQII